MNDVIKSINVDGVEYDIQAKELTKVTYAELKELRDNGGLVAGHLYRITDYEFTTKQVETKSAGHVFDIIVLAVAENELSHIARAIAHEGDTYFDGNDLGAWELWYELDNDAEKYAWADAENGKGIIYRMIDEKRNDCPYDFKNALFYNEKLTGGTTSDKYYYTFSCLDSDDVLYDCTVDKHVTTCYGNSMGVTWTFLGKKEMNKNVFRNMGFGSHCKHNTFGNGCSYNTFGTSCNYNNFGYSCKSNVFGTNCDYNSFHERCSDNTFGESCSYNNFKRDCKSNIFTTYCSYNNFGTSCSYNNFGYSCNSNTFNNYCAYNTFGENCRDNNFGYYCRDNNFGEKVSYRTINLEKTSITLNDEYFDDGSGQLVPIKHPDLSTQPSILPYKFMGNYVYEQLIPMVFRAGAWLIESTAAAAIPVSGMSILEISAVTRYKGMLMLMQVKSLNYRDEGIYLNFGDNDEGCPRISDVKFSIDNVYARVVYTSMPEENGGYYYGYGNELPTTGILIEYLSDDIDNIKGFSIEGRSAEAIHIGDNYWLIDVFPSALDARFYLIPHTHDGNSTKAQQWTTYKLDGSYIAGNTIGADGKFYVRAENNEDFVLIKLFE